MRSDFAQVSHVPKFYEPPIYVMSIFIAEQIYLRCQQFAMDKLEFPKPDEEIKEIPEIKDIVNQRIAEAKKEERCPYTIPIRYGRLVLCLRPDIA